jgi:hypothetical protein
MHREKNHKLLSLREAWPSSNQLKILFIYIYLGAKCTALRAHSTALGASPLMRQYIEAKLWCSHDVEFFWSPTATWWPNRAISLCPSRDDARFSSGPVDRFALDIIALIQIHGINISQLSGHCLHVLISFDNHLF